MFGEKLKVLIDRKAGINLIEIRGFVGCIGSGKNYKCDKLKQDGFLQLDFADCLREMTWRMLDWQPKNPEEYDLFKKGLFDIPKLGKLNGRLILQRLGATMREIDSDFWVKQWKNAVDRAISMGYTKFCVSDLRYPNEYKALKSFNWKAKVDIEFCDYHSERYNATDTHESEKFAQELLKMGYKDGDKILLS